MTKKILSCLLALTFCLLCFWGCAKKDDGVPEGMYSVTREGEPFILYVQGDWTDNRDSGMSSAYLMNDGVFVSARYYTLDKDSLDAYIDECVSVYEGYSGFKAVLRDSKAMLGGQSAVKYQFSFDRVISEGAAPVNTTVIQYYTLHKGDVILLSFYCLTQRYNEEYVEIFDKIRQEFVLCDKKAVNHTVTDDDTPAGMKLASFKGAEFLFYAPDSWLTDMSDKLTEAKCADHGCNITLSAYLPSAQMTVEDYFKLCEKSYKATMGESYQLLESKERKVAERDAVSYTYTATYAAKSYKINQTVLYFNDMFYSITYTALTENFDAHSAEVEKMLSEFKFH